MITVTDEFVSFSNKSSRRLQYKGLIRKESIYLSVSKEMRLKNEMQSWELQFVSVFFTCV